MEKISFEADDYAYNEAGNKAIKKLVDKNKLDKVSVLANYIKSLKKNSYLFLLKQSIAAHINLIEGTPVLLPNKIPSLVDRNGRFYSSPVFITRLLLGYISKTDLKREITAQIILLQSLGFYIDEINSHQHIHALSPIDEITLSVAEECHVKRVRSYKSIIALTTKAKITLNLLKLTSILTNIKEHQKTKLPISWKIEDHHTTLFMSWEGTGLKLKDFSKLRKHFKVIIHPGLKFDTNTNYKNILNA